MNGIKETISKRANLFKILLFVAAAAVIAYFFPGNSNREYVYTVGKPWSYSLLTAPFDMPVFLDSVTIKEKKDSIDTAKERRQVWYVKRIPFFAFSFWNRYSMMGTGANAQVFRSAISAPFMPMPPMIIAFIATRNICKPKKEQQFTTSQLPKK